MNRRSFCKLGGLCAVSLPALAFQEVKSKLKITGVRIVQTRSKRPVPTYTPAPGSWSTSGVEVAKFLSRCRPSIEWWILWIRLSLKT